MQDDEDQHDDVAEEGLEIPRFGAWQPLFQPYFPEWRQNLELPEFEPRDGTFIFRVSLGKTCWRSIAMPADTTLGDLVNWILRSVNFDRDHLYEITYRDRMGVTCSASHPAMDEPPYADNISIGSLPLEPGQSMDLMYDFGDNWRFTIKLERVEPPSGKAKPKAPRILEKHGKSPVQYAALRRLVSREPHRGRAGSSHGFRRPHARCLLGGASRPRACLDSGNDPCIRRGRAHQELSLTSAAGGIRLHELDAVLTVCLGNVALAAIGDDLAVGRSQPPAKLL